MGSGAKCDPTRIQISDISFTMYDPLARSVRRRLRLQGVPSGIPVVYSTEVPGEVKLLPLPEEEFQKGNVKELGAFDDFRVRILPVLGAPISILLFTRVRFDQFPANRAITGDLWSQHCDLYPLRARGQADLEPPPRQGPQEVQRASRARPPEARGKVPRPPAQVRTSPPFPFSASPSSNSRPHPIRR